MDVKADDIPAMCAEAPTFEDAVWIACASRRRNGKMHSHQTKVPVAARRQFGWEIISQVGPLVSNLVVRNSFDQFYDIIWGLRPAGIGPLTTYDVAVRLGAYLKLEPQSLYLHTGARMGWDAMWGGDRLGQANVRVPKEIWPAPLRRLSADMAEDFLCTYRDALQAIRRDQHGYPV
jgi:hypothetical protein